MAFLNTKHFDIHHPQWYFILFTKCLKTCLQADFSVQVAHSNLLNYSQLQHLQKPLYTHQLHLAYIQRYGDTMRLSPFFNHCMQKQLLSLCWHVLRQRAVLGGWEKSYYVTPCVLGPAAKIEWQQLLTQYLKYSANALVQDVSWHLARVLVNTWLQLKTA